MFVLTFIFRIFDAAIQCEEPFVANADSLLDSQGPYEMSSTVIFQCRSGYDMKGAATQICDVDGNWSPGLPTCEGRS